MCNFMPEQSADLSMYSESTDMFFTFETEEKRAPHACSKSTDSNRF